MRNHRRKYRPTITIATSSKPALVMPAAIGASGVGMPKLTFESISEARDKRAEDRAMRSLENSLLELRSPIATSSIADFDCPGRSAGYLVSRSVKNSRMSKGEKLEIRLSGTRNPSAKARPTGGAWKGPDNSERRIQRNW